MPQSRIKGILKWTKDFCYSEQASRCKESAGSTFGYNLPFGLTIRPTFHRNYMDTVANQRIFLELEIERDLKCTRRLGGIYLLVGLILEEKAGPSSDCRRSIAIIFF
jgi:hypothetical protein